MSDPRAVLHLRMRDGRVALAEKDCGCVTHDGPHWLHMDTLSAKLNRDTLERGGRWAVVAFAQQEQQRLTEKAWQMKALGVVEIIRFEVEELADAA